MKWFAALLGAILVVAGVGGAVGALPHGAPSLGPVLATVGLAGGLTLAPIGWVAARRFVDGTDDP